MWILMKKEHGSENHKNGTVQACSLKKKSKHQSSWKHILYHLHHLQILVVLRHYHHHHQIFLQGPKRQEHSPSCTRKRRMKIILHSFAYSDCEPVGFEEAVQDRRWKEAMDEEFRSIEKNST